MIEETATVVRRQGPRIWVRAESQSTCGHCAARSGCGTAVLGRYFGRRQPELELEDESGAQPGEQVRLGIRESALLRGSLAIYLVPLLSLAAAALLVELLGASEGYVVLAGLAGLALGFAWVTRLNHRLAADPRFQPVVLGRLGPTDNGQPLKFHTVQRD